MDTKKTYTEAELILLIQEKNQKAFSYLYDNYSQALFSVITHLIKDNEEAEDVLQNSFVKIWNNFATYDPSKGRLYTWMLNITRNLAIDSLRSKVNKNKSNNQELTEIVYHKSNLVVNDKTHETIGFNNFLNNLKEDHKTLIDLVYFEGYTQDEISKKLNIPLGTVKTKIRQALLTLRELTKKELF